LRGIIALIGLLGGKGKVEEAARHGEDPGGHAAGQRKGEGRGMEGGDDRWGHGVSGRGEKEKKKGEAGRCGRGLGGPWASWARREVRSFFFFFFSLFQTQLNPTFKLKFIQNLFKLFHKNFINFLDLTQATKKPCIAK
jgi:hypothetical protein